MKRLLPHPLGTALLLGIWLLMAQSLSPGQLLLGGIAALVGASAAATLRRARPSAIRLRPAIRLAGVVLIDIVRSNLAVAAIVLFPRQRVSNFIRIPLDLDDPHGLALLALIITATPGTCWVDLDRKRRILLIHVLDLIDEEQMTALIKNRYEALLMQMFRP